MKILEKLNMTQYQKKVIYALIKYDKLNAAQISKISKIAPNKVYQTIGELIDKNIIAQTKTTPKMYSLTNFENHLKNEIDKKQKELSELEYEFDDFKKSYSSIKGNEDEFWMLESLNALIHKIEPIMQNLQEENVGIVEEWSSRYSLLKIAKNKIKEGKKIKFIGNIDKDNIEHVKKWLKIGALIRHYNINKKAGYGVFDKAHIKISLSGKNNLKSIWIDNEYLAEILKEQFEMLWDKAAPVTLENIEEFI